MSRRWNKKRGNEREEQQRRMNGHNKTRNNFKQVPRLVSKRVYVNAGLE